MLDNVLMSKDGIIASIPWSKLNEIMKDVINIIPS